MVIIIKHSTKAIYIYMMHSLLCPKITTQQFGLFVAVRIDIQQSILSNNNWHSSWKSNYTPSIMYISQSMQMHQLPIRCADLIVQ